MRAISQKKGKKGHNIWKLGQKCTKFGNILKKGSLVCNYHTDETARICPGGMIKNSLFQISSLEFFIK